MLKIEQKPLESGEIEMLEHALVSSKQIAQCTDDEITEMLKGLFLMMGLRKQHLPSKEEKILLLSFIRVNYFTKTINEFPFAFNLALSDKLELEPNEVTLYDVFSCAYLAKIMTAYRKWAKRIAANKASLPVKPAVGLLENKKELTKKEWDEWIKDLQHQVESKTIDFDMLPTSPYDYYYGKGKLKHKGGEKAELLQKAANYCKGCMDIHDRGFTEFMRMYNTGEFEGSNKDWVRTTAKRMAIWVHLLKKDIKLIEPKKR
jgi:hypothetical protein